MPSFLKQFKKICLKNKQFMKFLGKNISIIVFEIEKFTKKKELGIDAALKQI